MPNLNQLDILLQGAEFWNKWRDENPDLSIDLNGADLRACQLGRANLMDVNLSESNLGQADLIGADLTRANLYRANLKGADLSDAVLILANLEKANVERANLSRVDLTAADLTQANLSAANFEEAILRQAHLAGSNLSGASLRGAKLDFANLQESNLTNATLIGASLIQTTIEKAKISGSWVYGINIWDLKGEFEEQKDLIITHKDAPAITVDNIKVAQFIYLILNNAEIRDAINTLTSKSVLILGRFSIPERKDILDALRNRLRELDLLPVVFDFARPDDKDFTETIKTLAGLSYFVIADVTNPKSSPLELQATVPDYQIPFVPIIQEGENPFAMMVDLQKKYDWVLRTVTYDSVETLMKVLKPLIIDPALEKRQELRLIKAQKPEVISGKEYVAKGNL